MRKACLAAGDRARLLSAGDGFRATHHRDHSRNGSRCHAGCFAWRDCHCDERRHRARSLGRHQRRRRLLSCRPADWPLQSRGRAHQFQESRPHRRRPARRGRIRHGLRPGGRRHQGHRQRRSVGDAGPRARRRRLGRHHRRAGARAAVERPQLPAARDADAGRQRAGLPERQGQRAARRIRSLGQRQRRHREPVDRRRRQQQRRRVEPHHPRVPVARGDPGIQDPAQQLRPRVRRRRRRADQHRHARRHELFRRLGVLLRPQRRPERQRTISSRSSRPAEGRAETERLRGLDRRAHHQRQAALLRQRRVEPRGSRHRSHQRSCRPRPSATATSADRGSPDARRRSRSIRPPAAVSRATGFRPIASARQGRRFSACTRCPT